MTPRKLLVTHHAPDLDAVGAVWIFKRFDTQHFGHAKVAFVNPGQTILEAERAELNIPADQVVHVDTGGGEFDHHQPERGKQFISATSLVYDYVCGVHPELEDDQVLKTIVDFVTEIDHFGEIYWPEASHTRYAFMLPELLNGIESTDPHDDDSQLQFGLKGLDYAYGQLTQLLKATSLIEEKGQTFTFEYQDRTIEALAIETENDATIKVAQKQGYELVVRKDPQAGNARIKARPDTEFDLAPVRDIILQQDTTGSWFYHASGKMFLNGSGKHRNQTPSPLTLPELITCIKEAYVGSKS